MQEHEKQFLSRVSEFWERNRDGQVFVTDKIAHVVKEIVKKARKNYLGIYDQPNDPVTGDEKYWPPLTESFVDGVRKSIDFDTKNISLYSLNGNNVGATKLLEVVLRHKLKEAGFDEVLNNFVNYLTTDGVGTLKFMEDYDDKKKKKRMRIFAVDSLNLIADESAECLGDTALIERVLMTNEEIRKKKSVWKNVEGVLSNPTRQASRTPFLVSGYESSYTGPLYPIYEYWGPVEKYEITGDEKDKNIWTEGHSVIHALADSGRKELLLLEENKKGKKPYDEAILKKVIGRKTGRGIPEALFGSQRYMNMVVETRRRNAQILQNGLFKVKKSMGNAMDTILSKISAGGIIEVEEENDVTQLAVQDTRASSYSDEDRVMAWGERNTGAYDIRRGEQMAASAPATQTLIQDRNSKDLFQLVQENIGNMLERFIGDWVLPWVVENIEDGEVVQLTGSPKEIEELDDALVDHLVNKELLNYIKTHSVYPRVEDVAATRERMRKQLRRLGNARYIELKKSVFSEDHGVKVVVTNEGVDRPLQLQKLQELLTIAVGNPGALNLDPQGIADQILDILDVPVDRIYRSRDLTNDEVRRMAEAGIAQKKMMAAGPTQAGNMMNGAVAPQQNATVAAPASPFSSALRQSDTNQTQLNR